MHLQRLTEWLSAIHQITNSQGYENGAWVNRFNQQLEISNSMQILYPIPLFGGGGYMLIVTIGITYGYHRYFSHKEFSPTPWQEIVMLYCGLLCGNRSPLGWVGVHLCTMHMQIHPKILISAKYHPGIQETKSMERESIPM